MAKLLIRYLYWCWQVNLKRQAAQILMLMQAESDQTTAHDVSVDTLPFYLAIHFQL